MKIAIKVIYMMRNIILFLFQGNSDYSWGKNVGN